MLCTENIEAMQQIIKICEYFSVKYRVNFGSDKTNIVIEAGKQEAEVIKSMNPWRVKGGIPNITNMFEYLGLITTNLNTESVNITRRLNKMSAARFILMDVCFNKDSLLGSDLALDLLRSHITPVATAGLHSLAVRRQDSGPLLQAQTATLRSVLKLRKKSVKLTLPLVCGMLPWEAEVLCAGLTLFWNIWSHKETERGKTFKALVDGMGEG